MQIWQSMVLMKMRNEDPSEIQRVQQMCDALTLNRNLMNQFESFCKTGLISKPEAVADPTRLHSKTTDVIIYKGGHYIEMLKDGKYLYRPSGTGRGKRSDDLPIVELYLFNHINEIN